MEKKPYKELSDMQKLVRDVHDLTLIVKILGFPAIAALLLSVLLAFA